jgi:hypothetical protein
MTSQRCPAAPSKKLTVTIAQLVRGGLPVRLAGVVADLPPGLAEKWYRRGRKKAAGDEAFTAFYTAVVKADAACVVDLLMTIADAAARGSKKAQRFLTRFAKQYPDVPIPAGRKGVAQSVRRVTSVRPAS